MANKDMEMSTLPSFAALTMKNLKDNTANHVELTMQNAAEQMEKMNRECLSRLEEMSAFSRCNVDAAMQASQVIAEGMKDMSQAVFAHIQQAAQSTMNTGKAMMGVKTMRELMEIQTEYMKSMFDTMMADTTRLSEIAVRCSTDAVEPINARVTEVVEKISERARKVA